MSHFSAFDCCMSRQGKAIRLHKRFVCQIFVVNELYSQFTCNSLPLLFNRYSDMS
jgi:hypothetical protein